ncbi:TPR repeat-containing protein [Tolypothrix tenuis PCC 7101]|uniref:TPR repeat-containing protein n=1 Tax=Tolypothrix tenuis PCC 7101 TaxID=231146 RepID=A0A1Z4MZL1_9CYAN|nr:tetratricopeptide repeat protein [Aulosira sp. FACHB-113]BAY98870.1 TPR repeat-containing protein [Tolypothrix tenuis PCC 7101]BAZ77211.1 TPR repeat-containing protein [Aulosira laxa NIES-50]
MTLKLTDWDEDLPSEEDEEYQALVRTLNFTESFGLLFVRCSPAEGEQLIAKVKEDISNKNIEVLRLEQDVDNLYEIINTLGNKEQINILFITGLEHSFYKYEECKSLMGWNSRDIYLYSWNGVPPVLINLNQQRERFKENFNICFVFLLPIFAIKYFIQRAPDFFDWRSGLFEVPIDSETLEQESSRIIQDGNYEKYLALTPEERTQEILKIQELIAQTYQTPDRQYYLLINLGSLHLAGQDYKEAMDTYEKALEIKPDDRYALNLRGIALLNLGRYEEAVASYNKGLKIQPDQYAWYFRGNALRNLGHYEEAIASYDKALELKPDYHQAWYFRGNALRNLGRYEEAIASYDKALELKPDYHQAWYFRGNALSDLGRYEEAIGTYEQAIQIKPDLHQAWYNKGNVLSAIGRYEEAIVSYNKALEFQPDDHATWKSRGIALQNLEHYEEAVASYKKVLAIKPDDHQAWGNRGIALIRLGHNQEAITSFDKVLEIQPDDYRVYYNKACCYALQSNIEQALENLRQAINLNPDKYREMAKTDSDFDSIRDDELFQALIQG